MYKRIGIFSGTFDPIHNGHIALAEAAKEKGELDGVFILVERNPRRKSSITNYKHRLKMCHLAAQNHEWIEVMELEEERFTNSDTLPKLKKLFPDSELNLIIGSDLFKILPSWPDVDRLVTQAKFIVSLRDDHDEEQINLVVSKIKAKYILVENKLPHLSSSKVRAELHNGKKAEAAQNVVEYAKTNNLY